MGRCNGEGWWPDTPRKRLIRRLVHEKAEEVARKEGIDRRGFMASACGMATTLFMVNALNGCSEGKTRDANATLGPVANGGGGRDVGSARGVGDRGPGAAGMTSHAPRPRNGTRLDSDAGFGSFGSPGSGGDASTAGPDASASTSGDASTAGFNVPADTMTDEALAQCVLGMGGNELIVDMQIHFATVGHSQLGPYGIEASVDHVTAERYPWLERNPGCSQWTCFDRRSYIDQVLIGGSCSNTSAWTGSFGAPIACGSVRRNR